MLISMSTETDCSYVHLFTATNSTLTDAALHSDTILSVLSSPAGGVVGYARTTYLPDNHEVNKTNKVDDSSKSKSKNKSSSSESNSEVDKNKRKTPVIGFDMGGTSTDVSRYDGKQYEHVMENTIAGVVLMTPQLDINTVAAGGGSQLFFRNGLFVVGPESAGANPGPACYKRGGYAYHILIFFI
jgi:N-methylhydantoinase A/oxoprolinase/acetone carboxylase beta subunit